MNSLLELRIVYGFTRLIVLVLLGSTATILGQEKPATTFYLAPNGLDSNPGTKERPLGTLTGARDLVRQKTAGGLTTDVVVYLRGGVYRLQDPVEFSFQDGGDETYSVTYTAYQNETPALSGGRAIDGWKTTSEGHWVAELEKTDWTFRELFINGERKTRARHPNEGYRRIEQAGPDRRTSFTYRPGEVAPVSDLDKVELVFLHDWSTSRVQVESIDPESRTLKVRNPIGPAASHYAIDHFEKHPRYYLENSRSYLDQAGEWILDADNDRVIYAPSEGEKIQDIEAVAPVTSQLLRIRGDFENGRPVRNLHFVGLTFEHNAWLLPPNGYAAGQAAYHERRSGHGGTLREMIPPAIHFEYAENCSFQNGTIRRIGSSGVAFGARCRNCRFSGNLVEDVSANGVLIGEDRNRSLNGRPWWQSAPEQAARHVQVVGNEIRLCGRQFFGGVAIWAGLTQNTRIAHNHIHSHPYTGVSLGWMWNPAPTPARGNRVEYNHIHHVMQVLSDGGGIYTLGRQPGSVLRGNVIHDVPLNMGRAESNGMFLDEGTTDFVIEENVIYNIQKSPLRFHRATTNTVQNNVLVVGPETPPIRYNNTDPADIQKIDNRIIAAGQTTSPAFQKMLKQALEKIEAPRR